MDPVSKACDCNKIRELVNEIINKFSDEKLSYDDAKIVIEKVQKILGECSIVCRM